MGSMRKMMAVMLMGLALTAFEVSSDAQSRSKSERKSAATANNRKPSPAVKPSTGSSTRPVRPDVKPGGTGNKPSGPAAKPNARVDRLVTTVKIKIQIRNMTYLEIKNFPLDIGTVSMVFNVCSLYSLPKR